MTEAEIPAGPPAKGILAMVERVGNRLPDPVFLFLWLIAGLIVTSLIASWAGWSVPHPTQIDEGTGAASIVAASSLLSADNIRRLWVEMPATFTHFHPLGYVLVVMLGAGVAERTGLFGTAMRAAVRNAPVFLLTPIVSLVGMLGNLAADAAYVVLIPLAGIIFHAAGRNPIVGIAACFAGVAGGFSANLLPGQLDALLFGITEAAVETAFGDYTANILGNWYFIIAMTAVFLPVIWLVTDRIIEPRLGPWDSSRAGSAAANEQEDRPLLAQEHKGLRHAALGALGVVALWLIFLFGPGTPLIDEGAAPEARLTPFYQSLVAGFFLLFLISGWAYGKAAGSITDHRSLVKMMSDAMADMAYYLVLAFVAAHFVAMFGWSNLGLIMAVEGADMLRASGLPAWALLVLIVLFSALLNLLIGSASAKWALLAPVMVPMLMLLGITPEMATATYRVGDSATNIITPLMVYFPLILIFCQRWQQDFGLGSLAATMLPYSVGLLVAGLVLVGGWVLLDLPLGPGAQVFMPVAPGR
ncbi:membrane protein [Erythrobacter sp. SG61-1L]|uniref:AbgT family transporter n=1 Tax=Erythrobacter sp. SG61-1L TaxID=1603897 RepID=UPI0006C92951|nr:AbgT family transporter [Erythrobacter sp. SG61-1L]KPL69765.1 membrane protein [Erythrobacter sp. SG61-1L]KPL69782.1 membrane protein [Erythrobacter sp. SG61-1L]